MSNKNNNNKNSTKQFNTLEELGLVMASYIKAKYPLSDRVDFMTIEDELFNKKFDIRRKNGNIYVSLHKVRKAVPSKKDSQNSQDS